MADARFQFIASGHESVVNAFKSIDRAAQEAAHSVGSVLTGSPRVGRGGGVYARAGGGGPYRTPGGVPDVVREHERSLKYVAGVRDRYFREEQRKQEQADRASLRRQEQTQRYLAGVKERHFRDEQAQREKGWRAEERAIQRTADERRRTIHRLGTEARHLVLGAAVGAGALAAGVVGGAARDALRLQGLSTRIAINARAAGEQMVDPTALRKEFERAAITTPGVSAEDLALGVQGFVAKTGRLDVARRMLPTFATTASASGASVADVVNAGADIFQKFDITKIEDMQEALANLTFQGKHGAFEIKDAAAQFAKIGASASAFGMDKGVKGVKTLGGLVQIARSATGSPEEAATAVQELFIQLQAKNAHLKSQGIDVYRGGKARDVRDILTETIAKVGGGDLGKKMAGLTEIFGIRGIHAINPMISTYNAAYQGATGNEAQKTAAGLAALRKELADAIDAPGNWAEVQRDAAAAQEQASAKLGAAWESLKSKIADSAIPAFAELADAIVKSPGAMDALVGTTMNLIKAFQAAAEFLGLTYKPTRQEKLKKAQDELSAFEATVKDPMNMTKAQIAERKRLRAAVDDATSGPEGVFRADDAYLGREGFAKEYLRLGGFNDERGVNRFAQDYGAHAELSTDAIVAKAKGDFGMGAESPEQASLRKRYQDQLDRGNERLGDFGAKIGGVPADQAVPTVDTKPLQGALDGLASSLNTLQNQLGQASIVGPG